MSRLRRLAIADRIFFVTFSLRRDQARFGLPEFEVLADVIGRIRARRGFLLSGWALMPDHVHALITPAPEDTLPGIMSAIKVSAAQALGRRKLRRGPVWQLRYFDRIIRTVKEYHETLEYMHLNPVRKALVIRAEGWIWSSIHSCGGPGPIRIEIDRLLLPADGNTRLWPLHR